MAASNTSTPRSVRSHPPLQVRLLCSFGGKILPRPFDNQLRYVGGDTHIVTVDRHTTFSSLIAKLSKISGAAAANMCVKYRLPNEDLDALITVSGDEDVENMMEEYDRLAAAHKSAARLRLFIFSNEPPSIFDGSAKSQQWFIDALNCETLLQDSVSNSDPGSPAPPSTVSSPFCSAPSLMMPDLPPVKTKPDKETPTESATGEMPGPQQLFGYPGSPFSQYSISEVQPLPVFYVTGQFQPGNLALQQMPIGAPYVPQISVRQSQFEVPMFHGTRSAAGIAPSNSGVTVTSGGEEMHGRPNLESRMHGKF